MLGQLSVRNSFSRLRQFSSLLPIARQLEPLRRLENGPAVLISEANQIHFNLALESYLMNVVKPKVPVFFWWRNDKNVVIGRNQNPWKECDTNRMEMDGIELARRFSGGGAVYQDLGNSCFTFLVPESMFKKSINNSIILNVLKNRFGVIGEASGRNDLMIDGKKFSGAAFKHVKDPWSSEKGLSLHHGTFLMKTDFSSLQKYLTPNKLKLQSKGISSVVSRVVNLGEVNPEITHETLTGPMIEEFQKQYKVNGTIQTPLILTRSSEFTADPQFQQLLSNLTDWNWRFGQTPHFSHLIEKRFDWGTIEVNLDVHDGAIQKIKIFTDCLIPDLIPEWEIALQGCPYRTVDVKQRMESISTLSIGNENKVQCGQITTELMNWIINEMKS